MIVNRGERGIIGLGFETTEEVHVVTSAVMVERNKLFIREGIANNLAPGGFLRAIEWVADRLPKGRKLGQLQALGQQALLNAELGDGPAQEAKLDITREPELTGIAIIALRRYVPWVQQFAPTVDPGSEFLVTTSEAMVQDINRLDPSHSQYAYDF